MLHDVLNGVLSLGDIRDVEKLCDRIASQALGAKTSGMVSQHDREDLVAHLISETWVLWLRYKQADDGRGRSTFSGFAVPQLRMRVLDWWRRKLGRKRPGRESKDNPGEWGVLSSEGLDEPELERVLGSGRRDDPGDRLPAFSGLQRA